MLELLRNVEHPLVLDGEEYQIRFDQSGDPLCPRADRKVTPEEVSPQER